MASVKKFVDYVLGQINVSYPVRIRQLMGEYMIYCHEKIVALVCDNSVYVKPTDSGKKFMKIIEEESP